MEILKDLLIGLGIIASIVVGVIISLLISVAIILLILVTMNPWMIVGVIIIFFSILIGQAFRNR